MTRKRRSVRDQAGRHFKLFSYGLSVAALFYVLYQLHLPTLRQHLAGLRWDLIALAIVLDVLSVALAAFRWRYLLGDAAIRYGTVLQATYVGTLFNEVLPLRTGDLVRGMIVARRGGRGLAVVLSSEVVERVVDGLALVVLVWFAIRGLDLPTGLRVGQAVLEALVAVGLVIALLIALRGESLRDRINGWRPRGRVTRQIRVVALDLMAGLRVLRDVRAVGVATMIALLIVGLQAVILWLCLVAYHIDLSVLHAAAVLAIINVGILIPNTPGNVGPWQFFCVLALGLFGIDQATAAGFSLVAFILLTLPLVAGGAVALATSPFTWSQLRSLPSSHEPFGGVLELVAEAEGTLVPAGEIEPAQAESISRLFEAYGYHFASYLAEEGTLDTFVSPDDDGFLSFTLAAGVAVVLGEPVAPPFAVRRLVHAFEATMATKGVDQFCYYAVSPRAAPLLHEAGYQLMPLGPEAVFYLEDFSLEGGGMKRLRNMVHRLQRDGARLVEVLPHDHGGPRVVPQAVAGEPSAAELVRQMEAVAADWEQARRVAGLGFTVSPPNLARPGRRRYLAAVMGGEVLGFYTFGPIPVREGWYLDNERLRTDAPPGTSEFLTVESHRHLRDEGAQLVSWGTTALARPPGASREDPYREEHQLLDQAFSLAYKALGFLYSYEGLYQNKAKYHPVWEESYLAFRPRFGPRIAYAVVKAHHPEGVSDLLLSRMKAGRQEPMAAAGVTGEER